MPERLSPGRAVQFDKPGIFFIFQFKGQGQSMPLYDYIIVGSGMAGLSVALAAAKGNRRSLIITRGILEVGIVTKLALPV